jgi:hypothetical protein
MRIVFISTSTRHQVAHECGAKFGVFFTSHHELGHGYYFMSYTRPEVLRY